MSRPAVTCPECGMPPGQDAPPGATRCRVCGSARPNGGSTSFLIFDVVVGLVCLAILAAIAFEAPGLAAALAVFAGLGLVPLAVRTFGPPEQADPTTGKTEGAEVSRRRPLARAGATLAIIILIALSVGVAALTFCGGVWLYVGLGGRIR